MDARERAKRPYNGPGNGKLKYLGFVSCEKYGRSGGCFSEDYTNEPVEFGGYFRKNPV